MAMVHFGGEFSYKSHFLTTECPGVHESDFSVHISTEFINPSVH